MNFSSSGSPANQFSPYSVGEYFLGTHTEVAPLREHFSIARILDIPTGAVLSLDTDAREESPSRNLPHPSIMGVVPPSPRLPPSPRVPPSPHAKSDHSLGGMRKDALL